MKVLIPFARARSARSRTSAMLAANGHSHSTGLPASSAADRRVAIGTLHADDDEIDVRIRHQRQCIRVRRRRAHFVAAASALSRRVVLTASIENAGVAWIVAMCPIAHPRLGLALTNPIGCQRIS